MYLTDGGILLRAMEPADAEILYRWENDTTLWCVSDTVSPFSKRAMELFVSSQSEDQVRLMIDFEEQTVGCADIFGISHVNHNASIGIMVYDKAMRRRGIAKRTLSLLEEFASSFLEIVSLKAEVSENNLPAIALFSKAGYREVGKLEFWKRESFGNFCNVVLFQKVLGR